MPIFETCNINENIIGPAYEEKTGNDLNIPKGVKKFKDDNGQIKNADLEAKLKGGQITTSVMNKLHLIKIADNYPYFEGDIPLNKEKFQLRTYVDLCKMDSRALQYDIDDFLYCKNLGFPINRMITLRRFPFPCTDNIWDKESQGEPDIARMITYFDQSVNKLEEILSFSYKMKWKELTAEYEQATMQGEQTGLSGFMHKVGQFIDPELWKNTLRGQNANMLDPKFDQNKVYGPVDSITNTHIRDVGLEYTKDFDITFDYELRSINGRTPEYAMKDILANVLACTYNNGRFWPGARYWIGERPSQFYQRFQYLNTDDMDHILNESFSSIKNAIKEFSKPGSAIDTLKAAMTGGLAIALGKILDKVGRPGILTMNSLLSGEPTGFWHLMIGNPINPIMCVGNLIIEDVEFSFPTDALSYGDFPTKMQVKIKLKPAQSRDRAGIEMQFNMGKHRIYYAPKEIKVQQNKDNITKTMKSFYGYQTKEIDNMLEQTFDFVTDKVKSVIQTVQNPPLTNNEKKTPSYAQVAWIAQNADDDEYVDTSEGGYFDKPRPDTV